jgi:membrane protease YdiL (CAAX protease family)
MATSSTSTHNTANQDLHLRITWLLVGCLFILRIPLFTGLPIIAPDTTAWVEPVYFLGTYFLTALLIWWERDRLADFHIDKLVLIIFIIGKPLETLYFGLQDKSHAYLFIALGLSIALIFARPCLPKLTIQNWVWLLIGILGGIALAVYFAKIFGIYYPERTQMFSWNGAKYAIIQQMLSSGLAEEPFFRGFLWGCLRKTGLKDLWIWLVQAGLFWLGHAYAFLYAPYSFWLIVPVGGLVLGLLAWRSRSIAPSIIAHGFANGLSQFIK